MSLILSPPAERFDPITARWMTPGGPLHDPERDSVDPEHSEPVQLIGPIPRELAEAIEPRTGNHGADRADLRRRLVTLAILGCSIIAMLIGGFPIR